ncbi:arrestin domain-containing protein 5 isoform X2 [Podarcis raffonei]|uniref:arrestin domain-containing protein 5 isoform X2 n=1 Tax=Podarcis raffonei TaxID=65483 RepID=UPI0023295BDB|nr:arrestin domain-containing protein 5 isoform X2 [Podarcis raffonei]
MSVVKSIELVIPKDVYVAGSVVEGQLVLSLHSTLVDPLVKVELIGRGYLEWIEETNVEKDYSQPGTCVNKADYVHKTKTFKIEREERGIPSTFTSRVGRISYFLQGVCATRELILRKQKKYLLVQGISVFRQDVVISEFPLVVEVEKALLYNCCFKSSPITLRLSLGKNIYAPGDDITFTTEITNRTGKSIKKVVFALHTVVLYKAFNLRAEKRTLEQREEMMRLESNIGRGSPCEATKINSTLSLPKVMSVSSSWKSDDIMDVGYELTATVHFPWCMSTLVAKIPIIIRNEIADVQE